MTLYHHQSRRAPVLPALLRHARREWGIVRALGSCTILPIVGCLFIAIGVLFDG